MFEHLSREIALDRTIGVEQSGRSQAALQLAEMSGAADGHLGASRQKIDDLAMPLVEHFQTALLRPTGEDVVRCLFDAKGRSLGPECRASDGRILDVLLPILQMHVEAVKSQARWSVRIAIDLRRLKTMADQHEVAREGFPGGDLVDVAGRRGFVVNAVSHHFAVGQAVHAGLLQAHGGTAVEMHTTVPQAIATQGVVTGGGVGQVGQLLQRGARVLERVAPVFQRRQVVGFRGRRWRDGLGVACWPDRRHCLGGA